MSLGTLEWLIIGFFVAVGVGFGFFLLYIYITTGFENMGRTTGGLFTVRGRPGHGKSYIATDFAVQVLKQGKRKVFSNYPIIYNDGKKVLSSLYFYADMIDTFNLNGSVIIHDESHQDNFSRDFKNFNKDKMAFYSRCSQHGITYYSIVQHEDRQDTIINDCSDLYIEVDKVCIPFLDIPIYFTLTSWASEEDMKNSRYHPDLDPFDYERVWFKKEVANAYNTKYFGADPRPLYEGETWIHYNERMKRDAKPSEDYSKITRLYLYFDRTLINPITKIIFNMNRKYSPSWLSEVGDRNDRALESEFQEWVEKKEQSEKEGKKE